MSKWIDKELFQKFAEQKTKEAEQEQQKQGSSRMGKVWKTPERGSVDRPKTYEGRFLPDPNGDFYKKYCYHMFMSGEQWQFVLCPKTHDFENWCPWCSVTQKLFMGGSEDKKQAYIYKRKEKFVGNFFIVKDPRDAEQEDPDNKVENTVRLYEFPGRVESKLKQEITDTKQGYGLSIFDPGEEGYNFILKVKSTKKDNQGRTWPDYSDSMFSRQSEALGSDRQIKQILNSCFDLEEYVKNLEKSEDENIELLKVEMVWEMVEDEHKRMKGLQSTQKRAERNKEAEKELDAPDAPDAPDEPQSEEEPEPKEQEVDAPVEEESDEALLAELENL
jgi:hypothetical protein